MRKMPARRGSGPSFVPKPEVHHHGGNCSATGDFTQIGVLSVDAAGQLAENIGTSLSAPIVASISANVDLALGRRSSRNLLKALIIINAAMNAASSVTASDLNYFGFGKPEEV
jgi:serine protease AprX